MLRELLQRTANRVQAGLLISEEYEGLAGRAKALHEEMEYLLLSAGLNRQSVGMDDKKFTLEQPYFGHYYDRYDVVKILFLCFDVVLDDNIPLHFYSFYGYQFED